MSLGVNFLAILACGLSSMILGSIWYSPVIFGKHWMELMDITKKDLKRSKKEGMFRSYALMFLGSLLTALMLNLLMGNNLKIIDGVIFSFVIWLGFVAPIMLGTFLWERKPFNLYLINVTYQLVNVLVMGMIISLV